jgi:hypothetical protein
MQRFRRHCQYPFHFMLCLTKLRLWRNCCCTYHQIIIHLLKGDVQWLQIGPAKQLTPLFVSIALNVTCMFSFFLPAIRSLSWMFGFCMSMIISLRVCANRECGDCGGICGVFLGLDSSRHSLSIDRRRPACSWPSLLGEFVDAQLNIWRVCRIKHQYNVVEL